MNSVSICVDREFDFRPEPLDSGVRKLNEFNGYTVDLRLEQFRKFVPGALPEFIEFSDAKGKELLKQMHEQVAGRVR